MQTNTTSSLLLFLNLLRRFRVLPIIVFVFLSNLHNAQTVISGLENISVGKGTVIYIDSTGLQSNSEEVALNKVKDVNNLSASNCKKLATNSELNKKAKPHTKQDLPKKIEYTYHSKESDSSISVASGHQIVALNSNSQLKVVGIVEETTFVMYFLILWNNRKISEKENFFAEQFISYKSSRAPPFC